MAIPLFTLYHSFIELDLHCVTERLAAMSYPADGIESAFKNHIDDVSATIESKHSNKVNICLLVNLKNNPCIKSYRISGNFILVYGLKFV